jgi:FkbM family methyltransferase
MPLMVETGMKSSMRGISKPTLLAGLLVVLGGILLWDFEREPLVRDAVCPAPVVCPEPTIIFRNSTCSPEAARLGLATRRSQLDLSNRIFGSIKKTEQDPKGFHLWETGQGRFWMPAGSDALLPFMLAEQQRKLYGTGDRGPQRGDIVLDCGANVGVTVREALKAGAQRVIAIEPAPENIEALRRNFEQEIASGLVTIFPKGVYNKDVVLTMHVDEHNSAANSVLLHRPGERDIKIPLTTIDKLAEELHLPRVDYIKMDIEGAEVPALEGAKGVLAKYHPRLSIAAYHKADDPENIIQTVDSADASYKQEIGPCALNEYGMMPEVIYFASARVAPTRRRE